MSVFICCQLSKLAAEVSKSECVTLELTDCETAYTLSVSWSIVLSPIYLLSNCNAVITDHKIFRQKQVTFEIFFTLKYFVTQRSCNVAL